MVTTNRAEIVISADSANASRNVKTLAEEFRGLEGTVLSATVSMKQLEAKEAALAKIAELLKTKIAETTAAMQVQGAGASNAAAGLKRLEAEEAALAAQSALLKTKIAETTAAMQVQGTGASNAAAGLKSLKAEKAALAAQSELLKPKIAETTAAMKAQGAAASKAAAELKLLEKQLAANANKTEQLQIRMGGASVALNRAKESASSMSTQTGSLHSKTTQLSGSMQTLEKSAHGAGGSIDFLRYSLYAFMAINAGREVINLVDEFTKLDAQIGFNTSSLKQHRDVQAKLTEISKISQIGIGDLTTSYSRYAQSLKDAGVAQEKVLMITESAALAMKVMGTAPAEAAGAMIQLAQSFGLGNMQAQEFNSIAEASPVLMHQLADSMGVPFGKMKKLAGEGKITTEAMVKAWTDPAFLKRMQEQAVAMQTLSGAFVEFRNSMVLYFGEGNKARGITKSLAEGIRGLADNIGFASSVLKDMAMAYAAIRAGKFVGEMFAMAQATSLAALALKKANEGMMVADAGMMLATGTSAKASMAFTTLGSSASKAGTAIMGAFGPVGLAMIAATGAVYGLESAFKSMGDSVDAKLAKMQERQKPTLTIAGIAHEVKATGKITAPQQESLKENIALLEKRNIALSRITRESGKDIYTMPLASRQAEIALNGKRIAQVRELLAMKVSEAKLQDRKDAMSESSADNLRKREADAIADLEKKSIGFRKLTALEQIEYETRKGQYKEFSEPVKKQLLALGQTITKNEEYNDSLMTTKAIMDSFTKGFDLNIEARRRGMGIIGESQRKLSDELDNISKTAEEKRLKALEAYLDPNTHVVKKAYLDLLRQITDETERQRGKVIELAAEQDRLNSSWQHGAKQALQDYLDMASNVANNTRQAFTRAFSGMEDALVKFTRTGKFDFRDMANSIIDDIVRIQVRQSIAGVAAASSGFLPDLGKIIGSFFGGSSASATMPSSIKNPSQFSFDATPLQAPKLSFAGGGFTGTGARSGGLDGQGGFMALLHPKETVIDHEKGQGGQGNSVTVVQNISIDSRTDQSVILGLMSQVKDMAERSIMQNLNRGGTFASAVGRA